MESNELKEIDIENLTCYYFNDTVKIQDFDFDNILKDKSHQNIFVYDILYRLCLVRNHYKLVLMKWMDLLEFMMVLYI